MRGRAPPGSVIPRSVHASLVFADPPFAAYAERIEARPASQRAQAKDTELAAAAGGLDGESSADRYGDLDIRRPVFDIVNM
jgi:hypothetical protein